MQTINCEGLSFDKGSFGLLEKIFSDDLVNHALVSLLNIVAVSFNAIDSTIDSLLNFYTITSPHNMVSSQNKIKIFDIIHSLMRIANYGTLSIVKFNKRIKEINPESKLLKEIINIKFTGDFELFENKMDALFDKETRAYAAADFISLFYEMADSLSGLIDDKIGGYSLINKLAGNEVWNEKYNEVFVPAETDYYPVLKMEDRKIINDISAMIEPFITIKKAIIQVRSGVAGADYTTAMTQVGIPPIGIDIDEQVIDAKIKEYRERLHNALDYINTNDKDIINAGKQAGFTVPLPYKKPFLQKIDDYKVVRDAKIMDSMRNVVRIIDTDTFEKLDLYNKHLSPFDGKQKYDTIFPGMALSNDLFPNNDAAGEVLAKLMNQGVFDSSVMFKNLDVEKQKLYDVYSEYMNKIAKTQRKAMYSSMFLHSICNIYPIFKAFIGKLAPDTLSYIFDPDSAYNLYNSILALIAGFILGPEYIVKQKHKTNEGKILDKMIGELTLNMGNKGVEKPEFNIFETQDDLLQTEIARLKTEFEKKGIKLTDEELEEKIKTITGGSKVDVQIGDKLFSVDYKEKIKEDIKANSSIFDINVDNEVKKDLLPILTGIFGNRILEKDFSLMVKQKIHGVLCYISNSLRWISKDASVITTMILSFYYVLHKFYSILIDDYVIYLKKYGGGTFDDFYQSVKQSNRYNLIPKKTLETIAKEVEKVKSDKFIDDILASDKITNSHKNMIRKVVAEEKLREKLRESKFIKK
jgi:hypothetical protein